jgi:hypothetical protein
VLLDEVAAYLQANQIGTVAQSIFTARSTDQLIDSLTLYELEGRPALITQADPIGVECPRIQVMCKAKTYADARLMAERAHRVLSQSYNTTIATGGAFYLAIAPLTPPFSMGRDQNDWALVGFNCDVEKYPSPIND